MSDLLLWMPIGESREAIDHLNSLGWELVAIYVQPSGCTNELVRMERPKSLRREDEVVGQMVKEWGFLAEPPDEDED